MTPRPPVVRTPLTTYTGREDYATDFARGVVTYTAACPRCAKPCAWTASPNWAHANPQCRCEVAA